MNALLLICSVICSGGRNIFSKAISDLPFGSKPFFLTQMVSFFCGSVVLSVVLRCDFQASFLTVLYAVIYGALLISAQYCYTSAMKKGNVGVCATVYSLGFILPTLSGCLFWQESLRMINAFGILLVIPAIVLSGMPVNGKTEAKLQKSDVEEAQRKPQKQIEQRNAYILPLLFAMLSSGGLGIMQKIQQSSPNPEQKDMFVILAFFLAGVVSFVCFLFASKGAELPKKAEKTPQTGKRKILAACGIGTAFGLSNFLNTLLAGRLSSALFFPILNISTILFSVLAGKVIYKEKMSRREVLILLIGIVAILLITA